MNKPLIYQRRWGSVLILLSIFGSAVQLNASAQMVYYIGFINKTGHDLDMVSTYSSNRVWGFPAPLVAGGERTEGEIASPIPREVEVRVVDRGELKSTKVSLESVPKRGFMNGTIYFVINTNGIVDVKPIKFGDTDAAVQLAMSARPKGEYRFGFVNRTGNDLQAVSVYYGDQQVGTGNYIPARAQANFSYSDSLTMPFPAEAEVQWVENGASHKVKVKLDGTVPKSYAAGTIFFVIKDENTVEVKPIKWSDHKGSIDLVK